ncbi:MAG: DUF1990 family protein [Chloroflexota bacterium]
MVPIPLPLLRRRPPDLDRWRRAALSATQDVAGGWRHDTYRGVARAAGPEGFARARDALLTYCFFPPHRVTGTVDAPDGRIVLGTTIVQRIRVAFVGFESGTRVVALADGVDAAGRRFVRFSYATLDGHPEQGIATFGIAETGRDGDLAITIETRSRAAAWWSRLGWPLTRFLQLDTNRRVLARLAAIASGEVTA